jgi:hypothetical protein
MGSDKRTLATDALETLGTIIDEKAGRDAIHLAVEPAIAAVKLYPGQDVGIVDGKAVPVTPIVSAKSIIIPTPTPLGIVDPFLAGPVQPGERFWLVVYPRQITSLRHVWTHPAFDSPGSEAHPVVARDLSKEESESWLREFCAKSDCPKYETVMEVILKGSVGDGYDRSYLDEEYFHFGGRDAHGDIPPEFWKHVEIVTGKKFDNPPTFFSCSC